MLMRMQPISLADVALVEPERLADKCGHFLESRHLTQFHPLSGARASFAQDNHSRFMRGVLRGPASFGQGLGS